MTPESSSSSVGTTTNSAPNASSFAAQEHQPSHPNSWPRHGSRSPRRYRDDSPYPLSSRSHSYGARMLSAARRLVCRMTNIFLALPLYQRVLVTLGLLITTAMTTLFFIYSERIFSFLAPYATKWRETPGAWLILWFLTFITAFPPLFGYSTTITLAGFIYGFPNGWYIVATATIFGSLAAFIASRTIFLSYVHRLVGQDKRFQALALTFKHDGLKVLCMIRFCPLPYSLSNGAISTFPAVHPFSFALATAISTPKLLIHVFIGSRIASIANLGKDQHMDASTTAVNYASIIFGVVVGGGVGWFIFQRTMARARELEVTELQNRPIHATSSSSHDPEYEIEQDSLDTTALIINDISYWEVTDSPGNGRAGTRTYRDDDLSDETLDAFSRGDVSEDDPSARDKSN